MVGLKNCVPEGLHETVGKRLETIMKPYNMVH